MSDQQLHRCQGRCQSQSVWDTPAGEEQRRSRANRCGCCDLVRDGRAVVDGRALPGHRSDGLRRRHRRHDLHRRRIGAAEAHSLAARSSFGDGQAQPPREGNLAVSVSGVGARPACTEQSGLDCGLAPHLVGVPLRLWARLLLGGWHLTVRSPSWHVVGVSPLMPLACSTVVLFCMIREVVATVSCPSGRLCRPCFRHTCPRVMKVNRPAFRHGWGMAASLPHARPELRQAIRHGMCFPRLCQHFTAIVAAVLLIRGRLSSSLGRECGARCSCVCDFGADASSTLEAFVHQAGWSVAANCFQ